MSEWEKELRRRRPGEHDPKYPLTAKEYKRWLKELSKKYGVPAWQIDNTIRELGVEEALKRLEAAAKGGGKKSILDKVKDLVGLWRR